MFNLMVYFGFCRQIALIKLIFINQMNLKILYCIPMRVLILSYLTRILQKSKHIGFQLEVGHNNKLSFFQLRKNMLILSMKNHGALAEFHNCSSSRGFSDKTYVHLINKVTLSVLLAFQFYMDRSLRLPGEMEKGFLWQCIFFQSCVL